MIIWKTNIFGPEYTPETRCQTISQRLTRAVAQNGGSLRNLLLTTGRVSNYTVVCYVNTGAPHCNNRNTLFTLKPESAKDPGAALASLLRFGAGAGGGPLLQDADGEEQPAVDLSAAVDEAFAGSDLQSADSDDDTISQDNGESGVPDSLEEPTAADSNTDGGNNPW